MQEQQPLLTKKALAISLSAPRAPPHASAHRQILLGKDPSQSDWRMQGYSVKEFDKSSSSSDKTNAIAANDNTLTSKTIDAHSFEPHDTLRQRLEDRFFRMHMEGNGPRRQHPHLPAGPELGDQITRALGLWLPHKWTHSLRDGGGFRTICDRLVTATVPFVGATQPRAARDFLQLSRKRQNFVYASQHDLQHVDIFLPDHEPSGRLVFFLHGGAWGSGRPWMYRLCALPFLQQGWAVAIPSYRTYPDGKAAEQVEDARLALAFVRQRFPQHCGHVTMMGHSSGAHIGLLLLVERARKILHGEPIKNFPSVDAFVGLSGPYDISHHFDYEAARGVEELSPMKPVCGMSREAFRRNSPALRLLDALADASHEVNVASTLPSRILLLHSIEDETVPFTATGEAARVLRSCGVTQCQELYLGPGTAHQDTAVELMLGGPTRDAVIEWIKEQSTPSQPTRTATPVRLHQNSKM